MKHIKNIFGEADLCDEEDLRGYTYATCTACMSIYSEFLSWANLVNKIWCNQPITTNPNDADNIVVLSCQVTDLAILNDFRTIEKLMAQYPQKKFFIGGCLANRFDIELPKGVNRLGKVCADYKDLDDNLVDFAPPFWVKDFKNSSDEFSDGNLFRNKYPLRIGVGCNKKCSYCTIRHTRGAAYELDIKKLLNEFVNHEDIVLIADSPSVEQIQAWCHLSIALNKKISIRNIEPTTAVDCEEEISILIEKNLLDVLHCPIQSNNVEVLKDMKRDNNFTTSYIQFVKQIKASSIYYCRNNSTKFATNIIVDYKDFPNPTERYV